MVVHFPFFTFVFNIKYEDVASVSALFEVKSLRDVIMCRQVRFLKTTCMSLVGNSVLCNAYQHVHTACTRQ